MMQARIQKNIIQPKLTIGQPGDKYEQEADAMADQVMRMPQSDAPIQRQCEDCEEEALQMKPLAASITPVIQMEPMEEEEEMLQAKSEGNSKSSTSNLASHLNQSKGGGTGLPDATNQQMSNAFGTDFSGVRVHSDTNAVQMNRSLGARAFTHGSDVYFNEGEYNPNSGSGKHLLAHELTHVVQQSGVANNRIQRDLATPLPEEEAPDQPDLTEAQIREAIRFNRFRYDRENTLLIQDILGGPVTGEWTEENILAIAETQEMYNLPSDGKIGPDTFRFIVEEQRLEGTSSAAEDCLTMFRVIHFPARIGATPGPGGITRIRGHHIIEAQFSSRCDCSEFRYRQFIAGVAAGTRGGRTDDLSHLFIMPGGLPLTSTEDENRTCPASRYGQRIPPGQDSTNTRCGENHYFNEDEVTDQANGCMYRGEDFPEIEVLGLNTGDTVAIQIQFRGVIERNGIPIQTKNWTGIDENITTR